METHKSTDEEKEEKRTDPQMRIFGAAISDNVIVSADKTATELTEYALTGNEVDVTDLYIPNTEPTEQQKLDAEMPLTQEMLQANNAAKNRDRKNKK